MRRDTTISILESTHVGRTREDSPEKIGTFHFYYIFEFLGMRGVHCMKKENRAWKYFFALKLSTFQDFSTMLTKYHLSCDMSFNFPLSKMTTQLSINVSKERRITCSLNSCQPYV